MDGTPLLDISRVVKTFDITGGFLDQLVWRDGRLKRKKTIVRAVNDVGLDIGDLSQ